MLNDLPKIIIALVMVAMVGMIGLGISQQAVDTVTFESTDEFCSTKDTLVDAVDDGIGWIPMLILAIVGGLGIAYVARYMGYLKF